MPVAADYDFVHAVASLHELFNYGVTFKMDSNLAKTIARAGVLRASINLGNPLLAKRDAQSGYPAGVSVDLATALAAHLKVDLKFAGFRQSFRVGASSGI